MYPCQSLMLPPTGIHVCVHVLMVNHNVCGTVDTCVHTVHMYVIVVLVMTCLLHGECSTIVYVLYICVRICTLYVCIHMCIHVYTYMCT